MVSQFSVPGIGQQLCPEEMEYAEVADLVFLLLFRRTHVIFPVPQDCDGLSGSTKANVSGRQNIRTERPAFHALRANALSHGDY